MTTVRRVVAGVMVVAGMVAISSCASSEVASSPSATFTANSAGDGMFVPAFERSFDSGTLRTDVADDDWLGLASADLFAAGAANGLKIYRVSDEPGAGELLIEVSEDPSDPQVVETVERYLVPVALEWAANVTIRVDPDFRLVTGNAP